MEDIKGMYKKVVKDSFPDTIKIDMGGQVLLYRKRVWNIFDTDEKCDVERGLRHEGYASISFTRPISPLSRRTFIPCGCCADPVSISLTVPLVSTPVR